MSRERIFDKVARRYAKMDHIRFRAYYFDVTSMANLPDRFLNLQQQFATTIEPSQQSMYPAEHGTFGIPEFADLRVNISLIHHEVDATSEAYKDLPIWPVLDNLSQRDSRVTVRVNPTNDQGTAIYPNGGTNWRKTLRRDRRGEASGRLIHGDGVLQDGEAIVIVKLSLHRIDPTDLAPIDQRRILKWQCDLHWDNSALFSGLPKKLIVRGIRRLRREYRIFVAARRRTDGDLKAFNSACASRVANIGTAAGGDQRLNSD